MVSMFLTQKARRAWLQTHVEQALAELPTYWQLTEGGRVLLTRIEFEKFLGDTDGFKLGFTNPLVAEIDVREELSQAVRRMILSEFDDECTAQHREQLTALLSLVSDKLRNTDVSALAFTSHQLHRRALFESVKSITEAEFTEYVAAQMKKLAAMVSESAVEQVALTSHELVPQNLRFTFCRNGRRFFVIQEPPRLRTVRVASLDGPSTYQMAFPYVTYVIAMSGSQYDHARICFQTAPLRSLDDQIFEPALPNIMSDLSICMDRGPYESLRTSYEVCEAVINGFWSSDFVTTDRNNGGRYTHDRWGRKTFESKRATVKSYQHWHDESQKNGIEFALHAAWSPLDNTVQDMINMSFKRQDVKTDTESRLDVYIHQTAEGLARKLQTRLMSEVPQLPLDDVLKQKLRAHVTAVTEEFVTRLTQQIQRYLVDKSTAPLSAVALEALVGRIMRRGVSMVDTLNQHTN